MILILKLTVCGCNVTHDRSREAKLEVNSIVPHAKICPYAGGEALTLLVVSLSFGRLDVKENRASVAPAP